jgi:nitrate/nitrite transporter NarK
VLSILALWGAATAFWLAFAVWTAVGPVVLVLTRRHGVHLGDLVALVAAYTAAAVLTRHLLKQDAGSAP